MHLLEAAGADCLPVGLLQRVLRAEGILEHTSRNRSHVRARTAPQLHDEFSRSSRGSGLRRESCRAAGILPAHHPSWDSHANLYPYSCGCVLASASRRGVTRSCKFKAVTPLSLRGSLAAAARVVQTPESQTDERTAARFGCRGTTITACIRHQALLHGTVALGPRATAWFGAP